MASRSSPQYAQRDMNLPGLQVDRAHIHAGGRRTSSPPRVLLADDHHAVLKAEIALLSADFDVVGAGLGWGSIGVRSLPAPS